MKKLHWALIVIMLLLSLAPFPASAQGCDTAPWMTEVFPLTDFCERTIDLGEVQAGCQFRECIPALARTDTESIEEAWRWLADRSPVVVVEINGTARAYPQAILVYHEIANDELGGVPIAVTYCPLCNSSIVYKREVDGALLEFAVSGLLRNSDLIMFDRSTETWWQQLVGEGLVGQYAGVLLDVIPSQVIGFGQFAERYPEGTVMSRDTGRAAPYGTIAGHYAGYEEPFLYTGEFDTRLAATAHVLAGVIGDVPMAYPLDTLADEFVVNDTIGGEDVVIFWQSGTAAMMDNVVIDNSRDIGTAVMYSRVMNDHVLTFRYDAANQIIVDDETGSAWNLFGEAVTGELTGSELRQLPAAIHFWFAWAAFYPDTGLYGVE